MIVTFKSRTTGVITLGQTVVPFVVKQSTHATKRYSYRYEHSSGVTVSIPRGGNAKEALAALTKKQAWLEQAAQKSCPSAPKLLGRVLTISHSPEIRLVQLDGDTLVIPSDLADKEQAVLKWYKEQARQLFAERILFFAPRMNVVARKVVIRDQRTRWGSCSSKGTLSFNWRLIMAPPSIVDAVIVHELAHLRELNHSPRFWAVVNEFYPTYAEAKQWLRLHGPGLKAWSGS